MFEIDFRSREPIYEQLSGRFRDLIITGVMKPDEKLPAVRALAAEITVNPNTIQKAYRELEHQGFIYSVPGKGSFVMPEAAEKQLSRLKGLKNDLTKIILELSYLGMSADEISEFIDETLEGGSGKNA